MIPSFLSLPHIASMSTLTHIPYMFNLPSWRVYLSMNLPYVRTWSPYRHPVVIICAFVDVFIFAPPHTLHPCALAQTFLKCSICHQNTFSCLPYVHIWAPYRHSVEIICSFFDGIFIWVPPTRCIHVHSHPHSLHVQFGIRTRLFVHESTLCTYMITIQASCSDHMCICRWCLQTKSCLLA